MTKILVTTPAPIAGNKTIATAEDGSVFTHNGELHVETSARHYIYKYAGSPAGWYVKNTDTGVDVYLGEGASPANNLKNLFVLDDAAWSVIENKDVELNKRRKRTLED